MLLQRIEERNGIVSRWIPTCQEYIATKAAMRSNLKKKLKKEIRKHARERWYLLRLKSKYAGTYIIWIYRYIHASYKIDF